MNFSGVPPFVISQHSQRISAAALYDTAPSVPTNEEPAVDNFGILLMLYDSGDNLLILYGYEKLFENFGISESSHTSLIWSNITDSFTTPIGSRTTNCTFTNPVRPTNITLVNITCPLADVDGSLTNTNMYNLNYDNANSRKHLSS